MKTNEASHYTFGDSELAAQRLTLLAQAFEASSARFLAHAVSSSVSLALDLGAGLGFTTQLLARISRAKTTIGYERSPSFHAYAKQRFPTLEFKTVDILESVYPDSDADLIYARFILTHVHDPRTALSIACRHLSSGGRLVLEETSDLFSPIPCMANYYECVAELQAHHGQQTYIGKQIPTIAESIPHVRVRSIQTPICMPAKIMARLHAMNISTWKSDPFMVAAKGSDFLNQLENDLWEVVKSDDELPAGICEMTQVVIEKSDGDT